jgi:hypothetical protein
MKDCLTKSEVIDALDKKVLDKLPLEEIHSVDVVSPVDLLSPERFDLLADMIYAKYHRLKVAKNWRNRVYLDCKKITKSEESVRSSGNTIVKDQSEFDNLLDHMKDMDGPKSGIYVPISDERIVINHAHQLAAAHIFHQPIHAIQFQYHPNEFDYGYFQENGLSQDILDGMALTYSNLCSHMFVIVVFPIARGKDDEIEHLMSEYGYVAFQKEVSFTKLGKYNLIQLLYASMHWIDPDGDITYGVCHHVEHRFWQDNPVKFYFLIFDDPSKILEAKERLRASFDLKNFSLHINDTHDETISIAEQILTPNSVYFMNHAQPWLCKRTLRLLKEFKEEIRRQGLERDHFCLVGDSVLAVFGLRNVKHIDFLYMGDSSALDFDSRFRVINEEVPLEQDSIGDLIFDPNNHFYFMGLKFISPSRFSEIKNRENSLKNFIDQGLIHLLEAESPNVYRSWRKIRFFCKTTFVKMTHIQVNIRQIRNIIPAFLRPFAKKIYHKFFRRNKGE